MARPKGSKTKKIQVEREHLQDAHAIRKSTGAKKRKGDMVKLAETLKIYGPEPDLNQVIPGSPTYEHDYRLALTWANHAFEPADLKAIFLDYVKDLNLPNPGFECLPDISFGMVGKIAWALGRGLVMTTESREFFNGKISDLTVRIKTYNMQIQAEEEAKRLCEEPKRSKADQDRITYQHLYVSFDHLMTSGAFLKDEDFIKVLSKAKPNDEVMAMLDAHYSVNMTDCEVEVANLTYKGKGKQNATVKVFCDNLKQGSAMVISNIVAYKRKVAKAAENNGQVATITKPVKETVKVERKPRIPKAVDPKAAIKDLKYAAEDAGLKVKSIKPENVVGAMALMVFNTKTRKLGVYHALAGGLQVKSGKILNYDTKKSIQKMLRSPETQLGEIMGGTLKKLELSFQEIKAVPTNVPPKTDATTLLLRVYK